MYYVTMCYPYIILSNAHSHQDYTTNLLKCTSWWIRLRANQCTLSKHNAALKGNSSTSPSTSAPAWTHNKFAFCHPYLCIHHTFESYLSFCNLIWCSSKATRYLKSWWRSRCIEQGWCVRNRRCKSSSCRRWSCIGMGCKLRRWRRRLVGPLVNIIIELIYCKKIIEIIY